MKLFIDSLAPDFSAPDQTGQVRTLDQYRGRWLLLYFYPKDFTPGCTTEACQMRDYFSELKSRVEIVGVSIDSVISHTRFVQKYKLPFVLLSDQDKKLTKAYGADGVLFSKRTSFLINPDGRIVKIYKNVDPKSHAQDVLDDLKKFGRS